MEPKRWWLEDGMMLQDDCGQFVDIEDYEHMESDLRRQVEHLKSEIELITAPPEAVGNVVLNLRRQLAEVTAERDDHERWLTEMVADYRLESDNFTNSKRVAINTLIHSLIAFSLFH